MTSSFFAYRVCAGQQTKVISSINGQQAAQPALVSQSPGTPTHSRDWRGTGI